MSQREATGSRKVRFAEPVAEEGLGAPCGTREDQGVPCDAEILGDEGGGRKPRRLPVPSRASRREREERKTFNYQLDKCPARKKKEIK